MLGSLCGVCQVQKVLGWAFLKDFGYLTFNMTHVVGRTYFSSVGLPGTEEFASKFALAINPVRRARVRSVFYLHSLKAAFLCKTSSVRRGNSHLNVEGY